MVRLVTVGVSRHRCAWDSWKPYSEKRYSTYRREQVCKSQLRSVQGMELLGATCKCFLHEVRQALPKKDC